VTAIHVRICITHKKKGCLIYPIGQKKHRIHKIVTAATILRKQLHTVYRQKGKCNSCCLLFMYWNTCQKQMRKIHYTKLIHNVGKRRLLTKEREG
jgi:hypothetical protein